MLVGVQLSVPGLYRPPVFRAGTTPNNHSTTGPNSCSGFSLASGTFVVPVAVQLFVVGLYLPPVFNRPDVTKASPNDHLVTRPNRSMIYIVRKACRLCW